MRKQKRTKTTEEDVSFFVTPLSEELTGSLFRFAPNDYVYFMKDNRINRGIISGRRYCDYADYFRHDKPLGCGDIVYLVKDEYRLDEFHTTEYEIEDENLFCSQEELLEHIKYK